MEEIKENKTENKIKDKKEIKTEKKKNKIRTVHKANKLEKRNKVEEINKKAEYCLNCKTRPCTKGCPLENNIPEFIQEVKQGNIEKAYQILSKTTVLQPICGLICPHMSQCQGNCVRRFKGLPTSIGEMEAFVGKQALEKNIPFEEEIPKKNGKKVAVVGGGPAGLTCSAFLARKGYEVTIYEKHEKLRRHTIAWHTRFSLKPYYFRKNNTKNRKFRNSSKI